MSENASVIVDFVEAVVNATIGEDEAPPDNKELVDAINAFFLIVQGIFVFFMQGGFAFLEAGAVR